MEFVSDGRNASHLDIETIIPGRGIDEDPRTWIRWEEASVAHEHPMAPILRRNQVSVCRVLREVTRGALPRSLVVCALPKFDWAKTAATNAPPASATNAIIPFRCMPPPKAKRPRHKRSDVEPVQTSRSRRAPTRAIRCREDASRRSKRGVRYSKPPPPRRPTTREFGKVPCVLVAAASAAISSLETHQRLFRVGGYCGGMVLRITRRRVASILRLLYPANSACRLVRTD
jgi:hypothetical protein